MQRLQNGPVLIEKLIAALSYLTMGKVGFFWLLLGIFTKNKIRPFLQYHIFQSIFISIAFFLLGFLADSIFGILSYIPYVNQLILRLTYFFGIGIIFNYSIIQVACFSIMGYLIFTSMRGQFSYLPYISEIIKANVKNS